MKAVKTLLVMTIVLCLTAFRNPPGVLRHVEMGDKLASEGDSVTALDYYSKAVAMEPENPAHYTRRGFLLLKLKRYDAALKDFSTVLKLEPANPAGYVTRGLVYSELKKGREAEADFAEACRLGSSTGCQFAAQQ